MPGPYRIIYADPPWEYNSGAKRGAAENHYNTTDTATLSEMDVKVLAAKDSVLLMWATWPCLEDAFELFKKWGFKYKTCAFNWIKTYPKSVDKLVVGLGHHTRGNSEICLIGVKGKGVPRADKSIQQIQIHPRGRHSAKPIAIREQIEKLYGITPENSHEFPRLEMFARESAPGWDLFGNQAPDSIEIPLKAS
jgi:site-specific DNA-methyltransferase (adenine-specific)